MRRTDPRNGTLFRRVRCVHVGFTKAKGHDSGLVNRGSNGEMDDFRWLLSEVANAGQVLPGLNQEELEVVTQAGVSCLGVLDRLVLFALLSIEKKK